MNIFKRLFAGAVIGLAATSAVQAQDPIKIALIHGLSGSSFEAFSKQAQTGFEMGIEYGTGGTGEINGRPIEVIINSRRRSMTSASAPPHRPKTTSGTRPKIPVRPT